MELSRSLSDDNVMDSLNSDINKSRINWYFPWIFYLPTISPDLSYQTDYDRMNQINILSPDFSCNTVNAHLYKETNKNVHV